jgi:hypothetical protein
MLQLWFVANTVLWPLKTKLGGISLGLNVVVLMLAGAVWLGKSGKIALGSAKVLLAFLAYVIFSSIVALTGPCNDHMRKSILTMPILVFLVLLGLEVGRGASGTDWLNLQKTALWSLVLAFSAFIVEMLRPTWFPDQAGYRTDGKLSGLFQEPSHAAFALFPCIAVLLVAEGKRTRQKGTLALLGLLLLSRSSTLIALIAAWVIYRLVVQRKIRQTALLTLGIAALVAAGAAIDFDRFVTPTMERIVGIAAPGEAQNISSLVYVQGWQDAWFNLWRTRGLGLGLNMMGCGLPPDVSARSFLAMAGIELNTEDGSFLFAKVVSEAGVAGIAFYIVITWWWVQLEKKLRRLSKHAVRFAVETQAALIFCFVASSFIRGSGYFEGGLLLWVAAVSGASIWRESLLTGHAEAHVFTSPVGQIVGEPSSGGEAGSGSAAHGRGE